MSAPMYWGGVDAQPRQVIEEAGATSGPRDASEEPEAVGESRVVGEPAQTVVGCLDHGAGEQPMSAPAPCRVAQRPLPSAVSSGAGRGDCGPILVSFSEPGGSPVTSGVTEIVRHARPVCDQGAVSSVPRMLGCLSAR